METTTRDPQTGDRFTVRVLSGYRLWQERPFECRPACVCGTCNGTTTEYPGMVDRVIYWADNSREAVVRCDDGKVRREMLAPPSGDACF